MAASLEDEPPITITAWTKSYVRRGPVAGFNSCEITFMHNAPGEATFTVDADHERVPDLVADGARAVLYYEPANAYFSGTVEEITGEGAAEVATRTFRVRDDWAAIFQDLIGWPKPASAITTQTDAYYKLSGPAETVVKQVAGLNAIRAGVVMGGASTLGRGSNISVSLRFHPLVDRLFPAVDQAGIGVRVVQKTTATRDLEVYVPVTRGTVLTEESGIVESGSYQITPPTVTRVVVGVGDEGPNRGLYEFKDTAAEAQYGLKREVFVDARDIEKADPNAATLAQERANEALAEGAAKSGLQVVLTETESFRFGSAFNIGDTVSIQLTGAPVLSDRVREVHVSWSATGGLLVTPIVGGWQDSVDDKVMKIVAAAAKSARNFRSSL